MSSETRAKGRALGWSDADAIEGMRKTSALDAFESGWDAAKADLPSREEVARILAEARGYPWERGFTAVKDTYRDQADAVLALLRGGE